MAKRVPTPQQTPSKPVSTTNAEGNEKDDNTSSSISDLQGYTIADPNTKIAGLAAGYREATRTK